VPLPKKPNESAAPGKAEASATSGRKPWVKKGPVQIVLEQADKLRAEIAEAEEDLKAKRKQLEKFEQAKKLFEAS
jgi:hypothetical protein